MKYLKVLWSMFLPTDYQSDPEFAEEVIGMEDTLPAEIWGFKTRSSNMGKIYGSIPTRINH